MKEEELEDDKKEEEAVAASIEGKITTIFSPSFKYLSLYSIFLNVLQLPKCNLIQLWREIQMVGKKITRIGSSAQLNPRTSVQYKIAFWWNWDINFKKFVTYWKFVYIFLFRSKM